MCIFMMMTKKAMNKLEVTLKPKSFYLFCVNILRESYGLNLSWNIFLTFFGCVEFKKKNELE